jgi:metallo-beta-lactamase family protein
VKLSFHGAARSVTGSCHLIECAGRRILVDCGLYQGGHDLEEENAHGFGFDAASIDHVLLTHAHLDHCGRLPLLVKRGFRGEIISTAPTRELARLVMLDAAHIFEEDARHRARRAERHGTPPKPFAPLYSILEALNTQDAFGRVAAYGEPITLCEGVHATFTDAGHILGSACVALDLEEGGLRRRVQFSGDLGYCGRPLLRDPAPPAHADVVVMESTYADRIHKRLDESVDELYRAISETLARGGNVVIPTFALERAQELLYFLREGIEEDRIPASLRVFLDSPMAISATAIFERYPGFYREPAAALFASGRDPLEVPGMQFTRDASESMALNHIESGALVMAGSGMCDGGRVRHHLRRMLPRVQCCVIFVGFASPGTLARRIIDGARAVRIFDEEVRVRARIHTINGFSAHADQTELLAWHRQVGAPRTFLVHGEVPAMQAIAQRIGASSAVEMPERHRQYAL